MVNGVEEASGGNPNYGSGETKTISVPAGGITPPLAVLSPAPPTPTSVPSDVPSDVRSCSADSRAVLIRVEGNGNDLIWKLSSGSANLASGGPYSDNSLQETIICVAKPACLSFTMDHPACDHMNASGIEVSFDGLYTLTDHWMAGA